MSRYLIRSIDIILSTFLFLVCSPIILFLLLVCFIDTTKPIFVQERVGKDSKVFRLYKFRSMKIGTPDLPTHLVNSGSITRFGKFLRNTKLDELPQLINVIAGDMSFVGPRPCLPSQEELIAKRKRENLDRIRPGITGIAQINNIDMSNIDLLIETEKRMRNNSSLREYFRIIFKTIFLVVSKLIH